MVKKKKNVQPFFPCLKFYAFRESETYTKRKSSLKIIETLSREHTQAGKVRKAQVVYRNEGSKSTEYLNSSFMTLKKYNDGYKY